MQFQHASLPQAHMRVGDSVSPQQPHVIVGADAVVVAGVASLGEGIVLGL